MENFWRNSSGKSKIPKGPFLEHVQNFRPTLHLDIGAGLGYNTLIFAENANEILAVDLQIPKNNVLKDKKNVSVLVADGQFLPFKEEVFDLVSWFSVIEHIAKQELALREALRVLKLKGKLIIQVPNKFFPLELHSGLPLVFLTPSRIRHFILRKVGYEWLNRIDTPSKNRLESMIWKIAPKAKIAVKK